MTAIVIRLAREADLPVLSDIELSAAETFDRYGKPLADLERTPDQHWAAHLSAGLLWVAEAPAGGLVGFLAGNRRDGGLYVAEVDVRSDQQRQGVGRRLMQAAIDQARSEGLRSLTLTTFRGIPWNAPFYRSLGFRELDAAQMPSHLAEKVAAETAGGLEDRCGMRLSL